MVARIQGSMITAILGVPLAKLHSSAVLTLAGGRRAEIVGTNYFLAFRFLKGKQGLQNIQLRCAGDPSPDGMEKRMMLNLI